MTAAAGTELSELLAGAFPTAVSMSKESAKPAGEISLTM